MMFKIYNNSDTTFKIWQKQLNILFPTNNFVFYNDKKATLIIWQKQLNMLLKSLYVDNPINEFFQITDNVDTTLLRWEKLFNHLISEGVM